MRTTTPSRKRAILPPAVQRRLDAIQHFLPHLTLSRQRTLALWCFGIQRARSHSLTLVSLLLAPLCKCHANAMRKRLKTWYAQTRNAKRRLNVHSCFAGLLRWMTTDWSAPNLLLALDTTTLRNRWIILTVSVLYKKRAIPVAWRVLAWDKQAWNPIWKQLLSALAPAFPPRVRVLVFADRGLYSPELFEYIRQLGAHPAMRVNGDGGVLVEGSTEWQMLQELVPSPDTHWNGRCRVFKTNSLDCTVLALWAAGMHEAWIVLTDLPPCEASAVWYRYRSWIEQGYRDLKRLGGSCHRTLVRDAARLERVWLALAVATLWVLWYGTDEASAHRVWGALWSRKRCVVSVFRRGWLLVWLEMLACVEGLCCGWFPDPLEPVEDGGDRV